MKKLLTLLKQTPNVEIVHQSWLCGNLYDLRKYPKGLNSGAVGPRYQWTDEYGIPVSIEYAYRETALFNFGSWILNK